ncbi:unnamed protein product [Symbiodinium sp. CCMP2592]|nr:unnamed protein product [Symbiodinium sp. CCMP2592]
MNEIDDYDNHLGLMNEIDDYDNHLRLMMNGMVRQLCEASVVEQWSFRVLDGKIMPKRGNGLITLIRDLLSGQDAPTMSRASALEFLKRQLPDNLSTEQVQVIVTPSLLYSDMDAAEWTAIEVIVALLGTGGQTYKQDARSEARQRTLHLLKEKMPSQMIAVQTEKFLPWLKSADRRTSASARHLFEQRISEEVLTEHFDTIVPPLLTDKHLHFWSIRFVTDRISRARLTDLIDLIIFQLPYQLSAPHLWEIAKFLDCLSELPYQTCISHLLRCRIDAVLAVMLSEHWETIWSPSTRTAASKLALKEASGLSRKQLVEHSRQLAALLRKAGHLDDFENIFPDLLKKSCPQHDWAELLSKLPVSCLLAVVEPEGIITWRDKSGNTWLHLAAEAGNCEACEALVDQVGHPLREKNKAGDEPLALAANREVDRILRSRMHFRETRFGHGNAFEKMMQDERQVSEVTWYTVPLPGMAGRCRGLHSFLVVTVSDTYQGEQTYVLEKAAGSFAREAHQKHGIFIGNRDLGSNLRSVDGLKMRKQVKLSNRSLQTGLEMKNFYEVAHSTGPYDLASSNCHHAVQEAFNHCCAREEDKELQPPNEWLAKLGGALQLGGLFNSASSGSGGSDSDVSSANSEVASGSQIVDSPSGFSWSGSPASDAFAEKAAALCLGVYEQDPAIALRPTEAGTVSIRNTLARPVLVYDHNSRTRHRVQADAVLKIAGCAAEKILVDIYADSWTGRCLPGRRLARRQAVWRGHRYNMSTDFRDDVVLQEAEAFVPKQSVEVLHATSKSGSSPVQWLLARSGSVLYVAFQGTSDLEDVVIDLCAVPDFHRFKDHGIGVHSGIGHALEQEGDGICHVVTDVLQALEQHRQPGERLVLCGHSLGGAYAQVMAVHLLSRNVEVTALRTFGAPHVLVPPNPQDFSALWQGLDVITSHFVHDWDPVPRIPLCKVWLTDVLPQLKQEVVRGVRIGIAQKYIEALQRNCNETRAKFLKRYDVVGEVVLVSEASGLVLVAAAPREIPLGEEAAPLKELLGEKPPGAIMTPSKLLAYHDMSVYLQLTRTMSAS